MFREQKIASFQQGKNKLQLLKLTEEEKTQYQLRLNRKRLKTSIFEYELRKKFLEEVKSIIMQTELDLTNLGKIYTKVIGGKYYIEEKEITKEEYQNKCYKNIHNIGTPTKLGYDEKTKRFLEMKEITYEEYLQL